VLVEQKKSVMKSKSISMQNLLSVISFALQTQTITINMNLAGKFKVRPIAGHELNWNHATPMNHIIKLTLLIHPHKSTPFTTMFQFSSFNGFTINGIKEKAPHP
jgi:hypothetical protein